MSLDIGVDPQAASLLAAIGITDADGQLVASWFDDPLSAIGSVLTNPVQRAALLRLLDDLLPPDPALPGWHPLLDAERGNLYLTVDDDVIGLAAALRSDELGSGVGVVSGSVRLPLIDVSGELEVIAGTASGPLLVGVDVGLTGPDVPASGVGGAVSVWIDDTTPLGVQAGVRVTVSDFDLDGDDPVDVVVDSAGLGADLAKAVRLLLEDVVGLLVDEAGGNEQLARLAENLFHLLGISAHGNDDGIPPIPFEELVTHPQAVVDWLVDIVDTPDTLTAWATHLAALIGDDLAITGTGATGDPVLARLVDSAVVDLFLTIEVSAARQLDLGLRARVETGAVALSADVVVVRVPLPALTGQPAEPGAATRVTQVVPDVTVGLVAPNSGMLIDDAPDLRVAGLAAGFRLRAGQVQPWLEARGVLIAGEDHGVVDLTDADAVIGVAGDAALDVLERAIGDSPVARALLTLVGLRHPDGDPTSPLLDAVALTRNPTAALAAVHRQLLTEAGHSWADMLEQLAVLVGLIPTVTGGGSITDPWITPIEVSGATTLALAAWNARAATDPADLQRLRVGLRLGAREGVFNGGLLIELLAFDLPATGAGRVELIGRSTLTVELSGLDPAEVSGLHLDAGTLAAVASWRPGEAPLWRVGVSGLTATLDGEAYGPYEWALPGLQPDLGLGDDALRLLGQLLGGALRSWGGEAPYVLTALAGLHRDLPELPADWPLLADLLTGTDQLTRALDAPGTLLRAYLERLLTDVAADGSAFAELFLRQLGSLLPAGFDLGSPGAGLDLGITTAISGAGRYDDPWVLPIVDATADPASGMTAIAGLAWLEPAGPPAEWIAALTGRAAAVTEGWQLPAFLTDAAAFRPELASLLGGRDLDGLGAAFDELAAWLASGDGLVPLAAQLPDGWTHGTVVAAAHGALPEDAQVITQVVAALAAGSGPVLLLSAPFADRHGYDALVTAITGAAPAAGRHFDLRALPDPAEVDLTKVVAAGGVYTADLLADHAMSEADQLRAVLTRIRTLTGQSARVVGHSTSGVVARTLAAAHPELVAGLITLGSPHGGSDLAPLTDPALAGAVRVAAALAGAAVATPFAATIAQLAALVDGSAGALGGPIRPGWFAGAPVGLVDTVPGLAIGAQLSGDLFGLLTGATAGGLAAGAPPTHLGFGVRLGLATPAAADGEIAVRADARVDLGRVRLAAGAAEPASAATAVTVATQIVRPNGWLIGDGTLPDGPVTARVRRVEAGVTITPATGTDTGADGTATVAAGAAVAAGGLGVRPWLRLVDAAVDATPVRAAIGLGEAELRAALDAVVAELRAAATPATDAALALLTAAGALTETTEGVRASITGLADLATFPTRVLTERRAELLAALRGLVGDPDLSGVDLGGLDPGSLSVALHELPLRLTLDDTTLVLRLQTTGDIALAGPLRLSGRVDFDTRRLQATIAGSIAAGPVALTRAPDGTVSAVAEPWIEPLTLVPFDQAAVTARLTDLLPDLAVSALVGAVLGELAGGTVAIPPVSGLIREPSAWLRRPDALGDGAGRLDGGRINELLQGIARALSLDDAHGLGLPGGFLLSTSGSDPLHVELAGHIGEPADAVSATVGVAVDLRPDASGGVTVTPAGTIAVELDPEGEWGDMRIEFGVGAAGVRLVVTPENVAPIQLLPTVSGFGELLSTTAVALLPKVLQDITDAIGANATHPVLDVALQVADALDVYAPATGFTGAAEAQQLRAMLQPGWLEHEVADPAAVIGHIAQLFPSGAGAGAIPLPAGHRVSRVENRLRWEMDLLPGCVLGAELGWAAAGHPQAIVTLTNLDTGPVTIVEARLGYLDELEGLVRARVDVGDPLAWFTPELEVGVSGERFAARLLPLGLPSADQVEVVLVPVPRVTVTVEGGLLLAGSWLLPLLTRFVVPQVETLLGESLWAGGPSTQKILHGAGLVTAETGALQIVTTFPEPPAIAMGALKSALGGVGVDLADDLRLEFAEDGGRLGIRLAGYVAFPDGEVAVTLVFGARDWIDDGGVTAWLVGPSSDPQLPVAPAPGLDITGVGVQIGGADGDPLVGGEGDAVSVGGIAALLFAEFDFWDEATRQATFAVDSFGGAVELIQTAVHVDGGDGDSFVAKLIPTELGAGFTTAIAYRDGRLEVHGGPGNLDNGIELTFPLQLNIFDIVFLRELYLAAVFGQRTDIVAALSGNAEIGPIAVTVTRVGLRVTITGSGTTLSFKPPDGFGFSLDASSIRLGGFLLVDEARGRYVGALEIAVLEKFALTAIGIVTTKHPDGTPGFSLLMLVTVTLPVPIPLGYGFFFAGAGGLLGLNRGMDVDRIRNGLRTGTADSILFPTDIINRIDVIIRDLEESFPIADGHFLIAPVGMIQWMNPALVTLKVGIILEIAPQPNIALLGVLRLALPQPDAAVVDLKVAFLGGVDVGASLLYFDAAIYDSYIGYADFKLSLEGDIAIRLCWGATPDLVVSIGGFHPSYTPAANLKLPSMRRLSLSLMKDNPRISLKLYFAVTSNTVQFGAELDLFVGVDGFSISGNLGFDVLVQFVPFLIDAHLWGRLAVTAGGADICSISLDLKLRGPTPWIAHGTASFKILFFSISVDVEATLGEAHESSIAAEPVLPRLLDAFRDPLNWAGELSAAASAGVTLLPLPASALVVDSAGLLAARQNLIPLATDIGLVGKTPPSDVSRVTITRVSLGDPPPPGGGATPPGDAVDHEDVTAPFAPSTFAGSASTNPDLLSAPAFEQRPNGVRVTAGQRLTADTALHHRQHYEMIVIDDPDPQAPTPPPVVATPALAFSRLVAGGSIAASVASRQQRKIAERGAVLAATTAEPRFVVTTKDALVALGADGQPAAATLSRTEAEQQLAAMPADGRRYQIVPEVHVG